MARTKDAGPKPRNDAYTGLLAISFLALVGGTVLMALDADELGKPPAKLNINVPGTTSGAAGEGLRKPGAGAPAPGGNVTPPKGPGMSKREEPRELPELAGTELPKVVVPVNHEEPADGPPLPVKPFVPPM